MNLKPELLRGVYAYGFERPSWVLPLPPYRNKANKNHSAIQQRAIMPVVKGSDVIAQAQSGTGKTATFSISALQKIDPNLKACQALILAPTRELAQQIQKVVVAIGDFMSVETHACIGGTNVRDDMKALQEGPQVVVGTPGRVQDMIQRRVLKTDNMKMFILDEADEMLSRGFTERKYCSCLRQQWSRLTKIPRNLRHLPTSPSIDAGRSPIRHHATRRSRSHYQVHARPCPYPSQEGRVDP